MFTYNLLFLVLGLINLVAGQLTSTQSPAKEPDGKLIKIGEGKGCLFVYYKKIKFEIYRYDDKTKQTDLHGSANITGDEDVNYNASQCWTVNELVQSEPAILELKFTSKSAQMDLHFQIDSKFFNDSDSTHTDFWRVTSGNVHVTNGTSSATYDFLSRDLNEINARQTFNRFSFSCSNLELRSNVTEANEWLVLNIQRFQLQPFHINMTRKIGESEQDVIFADSFDCSTFWTLPTFMGLFTLLLYIIIIGSGIYFLMQIKTPDRYENPKGKPLMITADE